MLALAEPSVALVTLRRVRFTVSMPSAKVSSIIEMATDALFTPGAMVSVLLIGL